jgi:hypothetical protein
VFQNLRLEKTNVGKSGEDMSCPHKKWDISCVSGKYETKTNTKVRHLPSGLVLSIDSDAKLRHSEKDGNTEFWAAFAASRIQQGKSV